MVKEQFSSVVNNKNIFEELFINSNDGIIVLDTEGKILNANKAASTILEHTPEDIIGKNIHSLNRTERYLMEKELEDSKKEILKIKKEKEEMQAQLRKFDRLNVIGELAAGIAHEIRNPMTALKGFIQLLEGSIKSEHSMYYDVISSELARIESIINEFLILAKPHTIRFQETDINQIMKETIDLLTAQAVLYNIQFKTIYDNQIPLIYCEPNQIKKVFINIIKNAIEVMPEGGYITITIKRNDHQSIHISIRDEGIGIPKEKLNRLGEPFYTTKDGGTGLGLMVSYRIIEEHNGTIKVESEVGEGTAFHLTLPNNL